MKKILCVLLVFSSAYILLAEQSGDTSEFSTEIRQINQQLSVVITRYNGTSKQIQIPERIDGLPVVGIGDSAFRSRCIESVIFPSTLVFIGDYAFFDNNIAVISIPQAVINIGVGAFDDNAIGGNSPVKQKETMSARTFTIEPAHSETVYRPKSNQPAPENVNIIVVPGYNPLQSPARPNGGVITVQQSLNPQTATAPAVRTAPSANQAEMAASAVRAETAANSPVQQPGPQQSYVQSQQVYGYVQQTPPQSNSTSRLSVIPENTIDINTGESSIQPEKGGTEKQIKLYMTETYSVEHSPPPR